MSEKIVLTPEQFKVFQGGNMVESSKGKFYNFPYWIKKDGKTEEGKDLYELYYRDQIPGMESSYKKGGLEERKYEIKKTDGSPMDPNAWYFVLRVDKDPHARVAAEAYAESVRKDNPRLANELMKRLIEFNDQK